MKEEMSPQEIEEKLSELPRKLWKLNTKVIDTHQKLLTSEMNYEDALDKSYLQIKAVDEGKKMTVRELEAKSGEACRTLRLDMIMAQAEYEKARNDAEACDKLFSAFQSIVKLRSSEMRSGLQSTH